MHTQTLVQVGSCMCKIPVLQGQVSICAKYVPARSEAGLRLLKILAQNSLIYNGFMFAGFQSNWITERVNGSSEGYGGHVVVYAGR